MKTAEWDKEIYTEENMEEELPEIIPSITAIPDAEKKEKIEKKGIQGQDNEEKDQKMEEVESASGQKTVRAAHVPVPSQVNQTGSNKPDIKTPKIFRKKSRRQ